MATDTGKRAASGKGLENKRKRETPPNTQGLKPPKAQGWWESSTTGAPSEGQGNSVGPWGRGRSQGKVPSVCRPALPPSSLVAAGSLLGCSSAGPRGGIGCKQAPEYCLMEPAKAQRNPGEREGGAAAAARSLGRSCLSPSAPFATSFSQDRACCFLHHPCSLVVAQPHATCHQPRGWWRSTDPSQCPSVASTSGLPTPSPHGGYGAVCTLLGQGLC